MNEDRRIALAETADPASWPFHNQEKEHDMIETKDEVRAKRIKEVLYEKRQSLRPGGRFNQQQATTLLSYEIEQGSWGIECIVLAVVSGFQPFVTWKRLIGVRESGPRTYEAVDSCVHGHYFGPNELGEAIADFNKRAGH